MSSEYQHSQTLPQAHCSPSHVIPAARDFHIKKGKSLSALNLERGVDLKGGCRTCGGGGGCYTVGLRTGCLMGKWPHPVCGGDAMVCMGVSSFRCCAPRHTLPPMGPTEQPWPS